MTRYAPSVNFHAFETKFPVSIVRQIDMHYKSPLLWLMLPRRRSAAKFAIESGMATSFLRVTRMLMRDPAYRFQTAAEVALAVGPFCSGYRLVELTQQAMQSSDHAPRDEPSARLTAFNNPGRLKGLPAAAAALSRAGADQKVLVGTGAAWPPRKLITRSVIATLGAIVLMAGILIRIQTDKGTFGIPGVRGFAPTPS